MRHARFVKVTSRELFRRRMVDVVSTSVCRCGRRFPTDWLLDAHILDHLELRQGQGQEADDKESTASRMVSGRTDNARVELVAA